MERKSPTEILNATNDERHAWLITANGEEIYAFLKLIKTDISWAQHGRDALNVALARDNIKLQTEIRDMTATMKTLTQWVTGLTVVIAILTLFQAVPIIKAFINSPNDNSKTSLNSPKTESNTNKNTKTDQLQNKKNDTFKKTETIDHKKTP